MIDPFHHTHSFLNQQYHLIEGLRGEVRELIGVSVGHDHQVPAGVGEEIENDEAGFPAMDDQVLRTVLFIEGEAESAIFVVLIPPDIFRPPGGVDVLHGDNFSRY